MTKADSETKDWGRLTPYQFARKRTEVYLGSREPHTQTVLHYTPQGPRAVETTWVPALFTALREIWDNGLDEIVTHYALSKGDRIDIDYDPATMTFTIMDNGRGIPINFDKEENEYAATVLLGDTMTGRNFIDDRQDTRGMNGVGASIVNFCSEFFQVEIHRDKKVFEQKFTEGEVLTVNRPIIIPSSTPKKTGTKISFKPSAQVFRDMRLPMEFVQSRVFEIALCYPRLKVFFNGKRIITKSVEEALFSNQKPIFIRISENEDFDSRFWLVPNFGDAGAEHCHSMVNAIPTFDGGVQIDMFRRHFFSGLLTALERESKKRKLVPNRADIANGLLIYNIIQMKAPKFDNQPKTRLITENVGNIIRKALVNDPEFFKNVVKKNSEWIEAIYKRCANRTMKADNGAAEKLAKKGKKERVEKLLDAVGGDRQKCILFLGEGDSAISGMSDARNPELHGGLPLRGKVMNVFGENNKTIWESEALKQIMLSIGLVPGERVNRYMLRYGKVFITTDADEDGKNIAALLVNFFYTLWPELFDPNKPAFVYIFDTPLIIAAKSKQRKYWYNDDYHEFEPDKFKGWDITRAKGLAALKRDDWMHALATPKVLPVIDDGNLSEALKLLFSDANGMSDRRKEWIGL